MGRYEIVRGDVLEVLRNLPGESFGGMLADPPYELGFMRKKWDEEGISFSPDFWSEIHRVLVPGAYVLVFGHSRTHHRLMVAMEDAGFELRDVLMWLYSSGFPKSRACLKPSYDPIVLARKPTEYVTHLNIDLCRIGTQPVERGRANRKKQTGGWYFNRTKRKSPAVGRWPANVLLDEQAAELLDIQSGKVRCGGTVTAERKNKTNVVYGRYRTVTPFEGYKDVGGASRFFYCSKPSSKERHAGVCHNSHTCVKPLDVNRWLAALTKTPGRLLVPFAGSGSEMIGALQAGWDEVIGIEREPEYIRIANRRIAHWVGQ